LGQVTRGNGATTTYSDDGADRLTDLYTQVGGTTRSRFSYTLDRLGLRTGVDETLASTSRAIAYSYDACCASQAPPRRQGQRTDLSTVLA